MGALVRFGGRGGYTHFRQQSVKVHKISAVKLYFFVLSVYIIEVIS